MVTLRDMHGDIDGGSRGEDPICLLKTYLTGYKRRVLRREVPGPGSSPHSDVVVLGDRYVLRERLGSGRSAVLYAAHDRRLSRRVAVRVLHPRLLTDKQHVVSFVQEAWAAASLEHPGIVAVHDVGQTTVHGQLVPWVVHEYVDGVSLTEVLAKEGPFSPLRAVAVACDVLDALEHAHNKGVLHRALTPWNVMVTRGGHIKVTDFGIAAIAASARLAASDGRGDDVTAAVAYQAPEQARGEADSRSDVYAVGCLLVHLLTGRPPFEADSVAELVRAHAKTNPPAPSTSNPDVPAFLDIPILRALAKYPARRYPHAPAMRTALLEVGERLARIQQILDDAASALSSLPTSDPAGSDTEPTGTEPTGTEPTGTEPTGTEPTGTEPTGTEPSGTEPTAGPPAPDVGGPTPPGPPAVPTPTPAGGPLPSSASEETSSDEQTGGAPPTASTPETSSAAEPAPAESSSAAPAETSEADSSPESASTEASDEPATADTAASEETTTASGASSSDAPGSANAPTILLPTVGRSAEPAPDPDGPPTDLPRVSPLDAEPAGQRTTPGEDGPPTDLPRVPAPAAPSVDGGPGAARSTSARSTDDPFALAPSSVSFSGSSFSGSPAAPDVLDTALDDGSSTRRSPRGVLLAVCIVILLGLVGAVAVWRMSDKPQDMAVAAANPRVVVPRLAGMPLDEAVQQLRARGLRVGAQRTEASDTVPVGYVTRTDPTAGATVTKATVVDVFISAGPNPTTVPPIVGHPVEEVREVLAESDLRLGTVEERDSPHEKGIVLAATPKPGTQVPPGSTVSLVVASGWSVVPDVRGLDIRDARQKVTDAGLVVGRVRRPSSSAAGHLVVARTRPAAGTRVPVGTRVHVVLTRSADPAPRPSRTSSDSPAPPAPSRPPSEPPDPRPTTSPPDEPEPTPTSEPTPTPEPSTPTPTPTPTPTTPSPEPTPTPTSEPTEPEPTTPTPQPGPSESPEPTGTPEPTDTPGPTDSPEPTDTPTPTETPSPTLPPSTSPTPRELSSAITGRPRTCPRRNGQLL